jgi:segregation and condensation protein B
MIELKFILEAILFSAQKPLQVSDLRDILVAAAEHSEAEAARARKKVKAAEIESALEELLQEHAAARRSFGLVCIAGAWQFVSQPEYATWLRVLAGERARPARLSAPALETLTIIAYRQPITRAEIEQIRGVSIDGVMQTLIERNLVEAVGRAEVVGRPMQYGTTRLFLEYFGLRSLDDMPAADELRRIPVERPPSLLTVEPGLATAPPEQLTLQPQPQSGAGTPPAPDAIAPAAPAPEVVASGSAPPEDDKTSSAPSGPNPDNPSALPDG